MTISRKNPQNGTTATVLRFDSVKNRDLEQLINEPENYIEKESESLELQKKYGLSDREAKEISQLKPLFVSILDLRLIKIESAILITEHYSLISKLINNYDLNLDEALESTNSKEELEDLLYDSEDEEIVDEEVSEDRVSIAENPDFIELKEKYFLDNEDTLMIFPVRLLFTKILEKDSVNTGQLLLVMDHYLKVLKLVFSFEVDLCDASNPEEYQDLLIEFEEEEEGEEELIQDEELKIKN